MTFYINPRTGVCSKSHRNNVDELDQARVFVVDGEAGTKRRNYPSPVTILSKDSKMLVRSLAIVGCFGISSSSSVVSGFVIPTALSTTASSARVIGLQHGGGNHRRVVLAASSWENDNNNIDSNTNDDVSSSFNGGQIIRSTSSSAALPTFLLSLSLIIISSSPLIANAADSPNWGIFEGRTGSLLHPIAMISMAAFSASTALLGFQWKRQRTLGDEISTLKKTLPTLRGSNNGSAATTTSSSSSSSVKEALAMIASTNVENGGEAVIDADYISALKVGVEIENKISELTNERKELASAGPRDKHFNQGALLLFVGTAFAIEVSGFSVSILVLPTYLPV